VNTAAMIFILCVVFIAALVLGKFAAYGDGVRQPMSEEELDRETLTSFYREIALLLIGIVLGASTFCLFAGYSIANYH